MEQEDLFRFGSSPQMGSTTPAIETFEESAFLEPVRSFNSEGLNLHESSSASSPSTQLDPRFPPALESYSTPVPASESSMARARGSPPQPKSSMKKTATKKGSAQEGLAKQLAVNQAEKTPTLGNGGLVDASLLTLSRKGKGKKETTSKKSTSASKSKTGSVSKPKRAGGKATAKRPGLIFERPDSNSGSSKKKRTIDDTLLEKDAAFTEQGNAEEQQMGATGYNTSKPDTTELVDARPIARKTPAKHTMKPQDHVHSSTPIETSGAMGPPPTPSSTSSYAPQSQQYGIPSMSSPSQNRSPQLLLGPGGWPNTLSTSMPHFDLPSYHGTAAWPITFGAFNTSPSMNQARVQGVNSPSMFSTPQPNMGAKGLSSLVEFVVQNSIGLSPQRSLVDPLALSPFTSDANHDILVEKEALKLQESQVDKAFYIFGLVRNRVQNCTEVDILPHGDKAVTTEWLDVVSYAMWDLASQSINDQELKHRHLLQVACMYASCWPLPKLRNLACLGFIPSWWWMREGLVCGLNRDPKHRIRVDDTAMKDMWQTGVKTCDDIMITYQKEKAKAKEAGDSAATDAAMELEAGALDGIGAEPVAKTATILEGLDGLPENLGTFPIGGLADDFLGYDFEDEEGMQ